MAQAGISGKSDAISESRGRGSGLADLEQQFAPGDRETPLSGQPIRLSSNTR
jgi:hypothetical protein